jgi:F-box/leucine-rich repeat protein 7
MAPPPPQLRATVPVQVAVEGSASSSSSSPFAPPARDYTQDLPDDILALVFTSHGVNHFHDVLNVVEK